MRRIRGSAGGSTGLGGMLGVRRRAHLGAPGNADGLGASRGTDEALVAGARLSNLRSAVRPSALRRGPVSSRQDGDAAPACGIARTALSRGLHGPRRAPSREFQALAGRAAGALGSGAWGGPISSVGTTRRNGGGQPEGAPARPAPQTRAPRPLLWRRLCASEPDGWWMPSLGRRGAPLSSTDSTARTGAQGGLHELSSGSPTLLPTCHPGPTSGSPACSA